LPDIAFGPVDTGRADSPCQLRIATNKQMQSPAYRNFGEAPGDDQPIGGAKMAVDYDCTSGQLTGSSGRVWRAHRIGQVK